MKKRNKKKKKKKNKCWLKKNYKMRNNKREIKFVKLYLKILK